MRLMDVPFVKLWFFIAAALIALLCSCSSRKKAVSRNLEVSRSYDSLSNWQKETRIVTSYFGDTLKGMMTIADTSGIDSAEFESNGIKIKLAVKGAKPGTKIDFKAEAKPVARSTLQETESQQKQVKKTEEVKLTEQTTKIIHRPTSGWLWLILIIPLALAIRWAYQKLKK